MNMRQWVKLPSAWMEEGGLSAFKWRAEAGASETAALMVLMAIAHRADLEEGIARATYNDLFAATGVSRTKIADGLEILAARNLVIREANGRSTFQLTNYGKGRPLGRAACETFIRWQWSYADVRRLLSS
ncbi:hypothetical protein [Loktanella sp. M215]|uniref:hypothetical protein n=1 Tax=Loktanella sp. M215 TaxID=2675431 RepID=UPI001F220428|nr:hypothetical protein [Loktanella sp. M215]